MSAEKRIWKCKKCSQELVVQKKVFSYLGHTVAHEVPVCPMVFIPEELVEGKMAEVEEQLEDK